MGASTTPLLLLTWLSAAWLKAYTWPMCHGVVPGQWLPPPLRVDARPLRARLLLAPLLLTATRWPADRRPATWRASAAV